jgi:hypothetical protein
MGLYPSLPRVRIAETACPLRQLYQFLPQNPGMYTSNHSFETQVLTPVYNWLIMYGRAGFALLRQRLLHDA